MKQHEDRFTAELPLQRETGNGGGRMRSLTELLAQKASLERSVRQAGKKRGPYVGAVKLGSPHHAIRVSAGKCQADFAKLAGISERSLRTWEADGAEAVSQLTHDRIVRALAVCGVDYRQAMELRRPKRQAVRYRDAMTGSTWSGRGLKPAWLRVLLDCGARIADFEVRS